MIELNFSFILGMMLGIEFNGGDVDEDVDWAVMLDCLIFRLVLIKWILKE